MDRWAFVYKKWPGRHTLPDLVISIISYRYIVSTRLYTLIFKSVPFTLCFVVMWRIMGENGKRMVLGMGHYITKKEQVTNLLKDIENCISRKNADIAIPILNWTKDKILLDTREKTRQERFKATNYKQYRPRAVKQWEVYGCALGKNIGSEQNGISRPVIIVQDTSLCMKSPTVVVIPLTSAYDKNGIKKRQLNTHIEFSHEKMTKTSYIKVEHIRCVSKARLTEKMCELDDDTIQKVKEVMKNMYNF